jgi:hypothetical protein
MLHILILLVISFKVINVISIAIISNVISIGVVSTGAYPNGALMRLHCEARLLALPSDIKLGCN